MWSSRNLALSNYRAAKILDHWDMWSSRNMGLLQLVAGINFRSLGYVV